MESGDFDYIYSQLLTQRQREVVHLFLAGHNDNYISGYLYIQEATVRKHLSDTCLAFSNETKRINRTDLMALFARHRPELISPTLSSVKIFGDIPNVYDFFGRTKELEQLEQWIINEKSKFVTLLGIGGIGKTTLTASLLKQVQQEFEYVIWKTLRVPISLTELLNTWLRYFDNTLEISIDKVNNVNSKISQFIEYLRNQRCLLVLDNVESIMQEGRTGNYEQGYAEYREFLRQIRESEHKSCLVITSRENPSEIIHLENTKAVRALRLSGLNVVDAKKIFTNSGSFHATDFEWQEILEYYAGNPLELRIVASVIQETYNGNISNFIHEYLQSGLLNQIRELFDTQFTRLCHFEKEIVYWLSINREPVTREELQYDIVTLESQQNLIDSILSLKQRSFIEETSTGYTLQPVLMKYVTEKFINQIIQEIRSGELELFESHSLVKAKHRQFIRDSQINILIQPILQRLIRLFNNQSRLENHLQEILSKSRSEYTIQTNLRPRSYAAGNLLLLFQYLKTNLEGYDFSNLTIRQVDFCKFKLQNVNLRDSQLEDCLFSIQLGGILWVVFSPDGNLLAASDVNGNIHIWEILQDKFKNLFLESYCTFEVHEGWIWTVRFSLDNKYLLSAGDEHYIQIWDIKTQQILRLLHGHEDSIRSIIFSHDGILASASDDRTIKLWNIENGECIRTLTGHEARVRTVSFNPKNPQILATASDDETVRIWNINTGECTQIFRGHVGDIRTISFSCNGQLVASGGNDKTVRIWNIDNRQCKILYGHQNWVRSVDFSPDGKLLLSASEDQTIKLWDTDLGECIKTFQEHSSWVQSIRFSPNGHKFASGSVDRTVKFWDINRGCLQTIQGYSNCLFTISFSPDGNTLASGYEDKTIRLWNIHTWEYVTLKGHSDWVRSVTFSRGGKFLASSSADRTVRLWDLETRESQVLSGHESWIRQVRFSPDDSLLASCSDDRKIKIWQSKTGNCIQTLEGHQGWVRSIAFNIDGQTMASAGGDGTVKIWNTENMYDVRCIQTLQGHDDWVWSVAFAPDGKILISAAGDGSIKIWCRNDEGNWENFKTLREHKKSVRTVSFSWDGKILATGGLDRTLLLWNTQTWEIIGKSREQPDWIRSLAFNIQGNLASASQDGMIQLWNLNRGLNWNLEFNQPTPIRLPKLYEGTDIRGATGLTAQQIKNLKQLGAIWT